MIKHYLDQNSSFVKYDKHHVADSISTLPEQIITAWSQVSSLPPASSKEKINQLVVSGMGGSALSARIIQALSHYYLKVPLEIVNNYRLPNYVDEQTLVVLSSYSGNTEETISTAKDALKRKAQIFIIASGGQLAQIANNYQLPSYTIHPSANPSNLPRLAIGYSLGGLLAVLNRYQLAVIRPADIDELVKLLQKNNLNLLPTSPLKNNPAKNLAIKLKDHGICLIAANHLTGTSYSIKNMLNENAKTFAVNFDLPELNHHLLESLAFPKDLKNNFHFLMIDSELYPEVIRQRLEITKNVFMKLSYPVTVIKPDSQKPLEQACETLLFGAYFSYYLSILNRIDPGPIPWVDYFKAELEKTKHRI